MLYAELTSTLRASGEEWHRAVYHLQNRRLQFLPVELPPGSEFIGARVAGESVRVDAAEGKTLLVPLLKTRPGELSYDVELVYRRAGTRRRAPVFDHWQMADPTLPSIAIEKTLWNVWLPDDARLLDSGGNVEPVLAELNETEKYESALADLRGLSATYASSGASQEERQRALSNFQTLSEFVTRGATLGLASRADVGKDQGALLKQSRFEDQSAAVGEKKKEIQREIDSLNTANVRSQQTQQAQGSLRGDIHDQRYMGKADFDGFVNYGNPIQTNSTDLAGTSTPNVVNMPIFSPRWRDNRATVGGAVAAKPILGTDSPLESAKGQLALNDSLAVKINGALDATAAAGTTVNAGTLQLAPDQNRLSTARALENFATVPPVVAAIPAAPVSAPAARRPPPAPPAATPAETPAQSLRSVGRISLAVDFPEEGQVYHFKKLKADARLTLWSARTERLAPLGWLALLGWMLLLVWAAQRRQRARRVISAAMPPA